MNRVIFSLIFALCGVAHAEVIATLVNKAGGIIALTNETGYGCTGNTRIAYSTSTSASTSIGCWAMDDYMVHIKWDGDKIWSYPINSFKMSKTAKDST